MGQEAIRMLKTQLVKSEVPGALPLPVQGWGGRGSVGRWAAGRMLGLWEEKPE
jgi:hypothetical protein